MSIYSTLISELANYGEVTIKTTTAPATVKAALYRELRKTNSFLKEMGMASPISAIQVTQVAPELLQITCSLDKVATIEIISRGQVNEKEL